MDNFVQNKEVFIRIIASDKNWIESSAELQLRNTAKLEGMHMAIGMPDLHPGKKHPIGATFLFSRWIYLELVGSDIGWLCCMNRILYTFPLTTKYWFKRYA